jgi:hypothetical protein
MKRTIILSTLALSILTACAGPDAGASSDDPPPPAQGGGGMAPDPVGSGAGGDGGNPDPVGSGGGTTVVYEDAVGAAYPNSGDGRIVLIDPSGTRSLLFNPSTGVFESSDDIDELEGGPPITEVVAAGRTDTATYMFDAMGQVTIYDHAQSTFSAPEPVAEVLEDIPIAAVGAAFGYNNQLFVFNQGGTSYAAYNVANDTWSPVYSFLGDFGGGGAPIASVGASYTTSDNSIVLFDVSGTSYCVYSGSGEFSDDFDIEDLGDGTLTFNDTSGD